MLEKFIIIAIGGGFGSALRFAVSALIANSRFPAATFIVNILGCFIIGLVSAYFNTHSNISQNIKYLFTAGFCGGFTTFSAFSLENMNLIEKGDYLIFFSYVFSSVIFGIVAVFLGYYLIK
ncbi:MAG: fluoride efflux transporter CrcB [Chitinispirillales bacterium]|jgi:CrcB protein|nr:fluoride efflux transporter CrcB [Chitinispirillales bacterium]